MTTKNRLKAKRLVMRHTAHGLDKATAKSKQVIASIGTERSYVQAVTNFSEWCSSNGIHPDYMSNKKTLLLYLSERSEWIQQKTLDQERQALQIVYRQKLPHIQSLQSSVLAKRSYTMAQVNAIASHQTDKNKFTTLLALHSGLRAHEPATILPIEERPPSGHRDWDPRRFIGFPEYKEYTVVGKGGLIRVIAVPSWLSEFLEARRRPPVKVVDRGIFYISHYDVGFGQAWSQSFSFASKRALGFSTGGHGLRHSFAKKRLHQLIESPELQNPQSTQAQIHQNSLLILSQELGHFRVDIIFCYLR